MYQMISEKVSKLELIKAFGTNTMASIVAQNPPSLGILKRQNGEEKVSNAVAVIVADLSQAFNGDLTKDDIIEVVTEIMSGLTINLSLEDVYLICRNIKISHDYKLKQSVVLKRANDYLNERSNYVANINYNKHLSTKFKDDRTSDRTAKNDHDFERFKMEYILKNSKEDQNDEQ